MSGTLLDIAGLTHRYENGHGGIEDISFSVPQGEYLVIAGPNGSGKTTLLRHLNGLLKSDRGRVSLNGRDILKDLTRTRTIIGMVFQDADTQIVGETVFDEVAFGPENLRMDRPDIDRKVNRTLEEMDLMRFRDRHPSTLSGGEKRRLTIAGILVMDPEIILFDEPFANLDYPGARDLIESIARLNRTGKTIIMATHDVDLVFDHAHRILVLDGGRTAVQGVPSELAGDLGRYGIRPPCACRRSAQPGPQDTARGHAI